MDEDDDSMMHSSDDTGCTSDKSVENAESIERAFYKGNLYFQLKERRKFSNRKK